MHTQAEAASPTTKCDSAIVFAQVLGSRSTFAQAEMGGHAGRALRDGDSLAVLAPIAAPGRTTMVPASPAPFEVPQQDGAPWTAVGVIPGPHGSEFFDPSFSEDFYSTVWDVSADSNRFGYRLLGPGARFCRENGGEGGSHPSNVLDYTYGKPTPPPTAGRPLVLTIRTQPMPLFLSPQLGWVR